MWVKGALENNCPIWKEKKNKGKNAANTAKEVTESDGELLCVNSNVKTNAFANSSRYFSSDWILDSGCSYHMCSNKKWFDTYDKEYDGEVMMGDGSICRVKGTGTIKVKMHDVAVRTLGMVRHIPKLRKNLIALGNLDKNGYSFKANGWKLIISKDCYVYTRAFKDGDIILLLLYVDDMLIAYKDMSKILKLKTLLGMEFDMKDLGSAQKILGMEIRRDRSWFNMIDCKPVSTPLAEHFKLSAQECPSMKEEKEEMSKVPYASLVGYLMYAMVCTHPDLAQAVSVVSRYMANLGKQHRTAAKWILRYLKGTKKFGILFERKQGKACVSGYVNSDYARDLDKRRSTTGYVFMCGGGPISWRMVLQSISA
ncbi:hypothetical protein GBA52_004144 [Prunus armeniaca]|nr:hypothetical protein GBA52_004144 [Prunus armeniaca]